MSVADTLRDTFSNAGFMPHVHCYLGKPSLIWTMVATDSLIGLAYIAISVTLYRLVRRIDLPFHLVFLAFGSFIGACGATHFMEVYNLWVPDYWAAAALKGITAAASLTTAVWLILLSPHIARFAQKSRATRRTLQARYEEGLETRAGDLRKLAESNASLERVSDRLELALGAAQLGIWDWDLHTDVLQWSETLKRLFGYESSEFEENYAHFRARVHPDDIGETERQLFGSVKNLAPFKAEYRVVWPDGSVHWIAAQGKVFPGPDGKAVRALGTALNIDEQKRSQEQLEHLVEERTEALSQAQAGLAHAAKLSALGEMAAGVAHEINTPLASISLQAEQTNRLLHKNDEKSLKRVTEKVQNIIRTTQRIADIIQGLRTFARDGEADPYEKVPAAHLVERALQLCQARFKNHDIALAVKADPSADTEVACRAVQIEQIILNLLSNAFDAVDELEERWVRIGVDELDDAVEVSVTDSGRGIPANVAEKMMQPFYTTKGIGRGTGLGLSISSGIAEAHGGSLRLDRDAEHTKFVLRLPRRPAGSADATLGGHA